MNSTQPCIPGHIQALLSRARGQLTEITPGPWGTGEHVDEPRAVTKQPGGMESLLALDQDGMAIFGRAVDAAFVVDVRNGLLAALCDALEAEHRRAGVLGTPCPSCGARPLLARSCGCDR